MPKMKVLNENVIKQYFYGKKSKAQRVPGDIVYECNLTVLCRLFTHFKLYLILVHGNFHQSF